MKSEFIPASHGYCAGQFHRLRLIAHLQWDCPVWEILQLTGSFPGVECNRYPIKSAKIYGREREGVQRFFER